MSFSDFGALGQCLQLSGYSWLEWWGLAPTPTPQHPLGGPQTPRMHGNDNVSLPGLCPLSRRMGHISQIFGECPRKNKEDQAENSELCQGEK